MSALPVPAPSRGAPTLTILQDAELLNQPFHEVSARYRVGNDSDQKALAPHLHALVRVLHTHDYPLHLRANAGVGVG